METTDEILEKAKAVIDQRRKRELCIEARICPECGAPLEDISETIEYERNVSPFTMLLTFNFKQRKVKDSYNSYRTICSSNRDHFDIQNSRYYYYDDDGW